MPSFWKRPVSRMYSYNLEVGEHYYSPMTKYLDTRAERGVRGETPGALTFSERLANKWIDGRRYDASEHGNRSASVTREATSWREGSAAAAATASAAAAEAARSVRAASEMRGPMQDSSSWLDRGTAERRHVEDRGQSQLRQQQSSTTVQQRIVREVTSMERERTSASSMTAKMAARKQQELREKFFNIKPPSGRNNSQRHMEESKLRMLEEEKARRSVTGHSCKDDVSKTIVDIHMVPWNNPVEYREAEEASMRCRARIGELERELEDITRKAIMTYDSSAKSAKQLAKQATLEADEEAKATKKSRKVMIASNSNTRRV